MANQSKLARPAPRPILTNNPQFAGIVEEVKVALGRGVPIEKSDEEVRAAAEKLGRYLVRD